jgi:hypothetical protein
MRECGSKSVGAVTAWVWALATALCVLVASGNPARAAENAAVDDFLIDEFGKSRLWNLDVPRQEVEPVIADFMNAYNAGDRDRIARLFEKKVTTDRGERKHAEIVEEYGEHFLATVARYLNLRNARWQKTDEGVMSEVDFSLREQSKVDNKDRDYTGAVRFYLSKASGRWRIAALYFAYDPPPDVQLRRK